MFKTGPLTWVLLTFLLLKAQGLKPAFPEPRVTAHLSPSATTSSPPRSTQVSTLGTTASTSPSPLWTTTQSPVQWESSTSHYPRVLDLEPLTLDEIEDELEVDHLRLDRYLPKFQVPLEDLEAEEPTLAKQPQAAERLRKEIEGSRQRINDAYDWTANSLKKVLERTVPSLLQHLSEVSSLRQVHCHLEAQHQVLLDRLLHRDQHQLRIRHLKHKLDQVLQTLKVIVGDPQVQKRLRRLRSRRSLPEEADHLLHQVLSQHDFPKKFLQDNDENNESETDN